MPTGDRPRQRATPHPHKLGSYPYLSQSLRPNRIGDVPLAPPPRPTPVPVLASHSLPRAVPPDPTRGPTGPHARPRTCRARGSLGARMRRQVHLGQLGSVNMRVDLRGGHAGVVEISACPKISWSTRRSAPPASMWVANECLNVCGCSPSMPTARPYRSHAA